MSDIDTPLSTEEKNELAALLQGRFPEEGVSAELDPGVTTLPELDGLLTALVSGPRPVKPSEWWPEVWGAYPPEWPDRASLESVFTMVLAQMNEVEGRLAAEAPFEPLFGDDEEQGRRQWCSGYLRGVGTDKAAWDAGGEPVKVNLSPMLMFGSQKGLERMAEVPEKELSKLKAAIPEAAETLFGFWSEEWAKTGQPVRREGPKVGRNDPCPCGSGKKHKKCCGK